MPDPTHSIEISAGDFSLSVAGTQEFVEEQFYALYEDHDLADVSASELPSRSASSEETTDESGRSVKPISEYLSESDATAKRDRVLVIGWYLESIEDQDDFTEAEIERKAENANVALGQSIERDLGNNVEDGYLFPAGERSGEDTFWVTEAGRGHLQDVGVPA